MRFRSTLILGLLCFGLGAYLYFVEFERAKQDDKKKTLLEFDQAAATAVTLSYADREIELKRAGEAWRIARPIDAPADEVTVENLIRAVAECEVKKRLDGSPGDPATYGLDKPFVTVKVATKSGDQPAIRVGNNAPVGFSTYAQRADDPAVVLVGSAFRSGMDKQVKDLRDRRIVTFDDRAVVKITLAAPDRHVRLARTDDGWKVEEPGPFQADAPAVESFLTTIENMRAVDFPDEAAAKSGAYGFDPPRLSATLELKEGGPVRVVLGGQNEAKDVYVRTDGAATVYTVSEWVLRDLNKGANDFRDKSVLPGAAGEVAGIEIRHHDAETVVLSRGDAGAWTIEGGAAAPDGSLVDQFVSEVRGLKGYDIATDAAGDLAPYGLDNPLLTIALRGKDASPLATLRFGAYSPDQAKREYAVLRDGSPTVFVLRDYAFTRVNKKAADFLPKPTVAPGSEPAPEDEAMEGMPDFGDEGFGADEE